MKTIAKIAVIGSIGSLAAYLLVRPKQEKRNLTERKLLEESSTESQEIRARFNQLPLTAHSFLAGIPIHSLDYVELKGGREQMTVADIYRAAGLSDLGEVELGAVSKALFWFRGAIGKIMRWDEVPELVRAISYLPRLTAEERNRSLIPPEEVRGISQVLYCFENEMLLEIINQTVHCFWCLASERSADGYNLYNAVYVRSLNWRTPIYMSLVSPMLKWIIYPAIDESIRRNWARQFPTRDD